MPVERSKLGQALQQQGRTPRPPPFASLVGASPAFKIVRDHMATQKWQRESAAITARLLRQQAERDAAPLAIRDDVRALNHAVADLTEIVGMLVRSNNRAARWMIVLTALLVVLGIAYPLR